mgnify:FL=1|jgi:hypothetical protein
MCAGRSVTEGHRGGEDTVGRGWLEGAFERSGGGMAAE